MAIRVLSIFLAFFLVAGCRWFKSEANFQIQVRDSSGKPIAQATVIIDKIKRGHSDAHGFFNSDLELETGSPILIEVSKPNQSIYFAPYFETVELKKDDLNQFRLTAVLYAVRKKSEPEPEPQAEGLAEKDAAEDANAPDTTLALENASAEALSETNSTPAAPVSEAAGSEAIDTSINELTFYIMSGREPVSSVSVLYGDAVSHQWREACQSNVRGRCSMPFPSDLTTALSLLVRADGFQSQIKTLHLVKGDKVRFDLNRGRSLDVFMVGNGAQEKTGIPGIKVFKDNELLGETDAFGTFIQDLLPGDASKELRFETEQWIPARTVLPFKSPIVLHLSPKTLRPLRVALLPLQQHQGAQDFIHNKNLLTYDVAANLPSELYEVVSHVEGESLTQLIASGSNAFDYIVKPTVDAKSSRFFLAAFTSSGHMVAGSARTINPLKIDVQITETALELYQMLPKIGTVTESFTNDHRINLGKRQGIKKGDVLQILAPLDKGSMASWTSVGTAVVSEAAEDRSRIRSIKSHIEIEPGTLVQSSEQLLQGSGLGLRILSKGDRKAVPNIEIYGGDQWLGTTQEDGSLRLKKGAKIRDALLFAPGFAPFSLAQLQPDQNVILLERSDVLIEIDSEPAGAVVKIDGHELGETPFKQTIPFPGSEVQLEVIAEGGYKPFKNRQAVSAEGLVLKGPNTIILSKDLRQQARVQVEHKQFQAAVDILSSIAKDDPDYPSSQHDLGEIYLNLLQDPVKAFQSFHNTTSIEGIQNFSDKRFIGTHINEAVALYQAGEKYVIQDPNQALSYWRQGKDILEKTEDQLRFVPSEQYTQAVHTLSYYRALTWHKIWNLTREPEDQSQAYKHWKDYIEGTALSLPQDKHYAWIKQAENYFRQLQTAIKNKPALSRKPVAM